MKAEEKIRLERITGAIWEWADLKVKESQNQFLILLHMLWYKINVRSKKVKDNKDKKIKQFLEVFYMFGLVPFRRANDLSTRPDPFDLESVFDNFFNDAFTPAFFRTGHPIRADIRETDKEYVIEADMPGIKKEDIRLDLRDGVLTIGVEHSEQVDEKKENYIRKERRYGSCSRSFSVDGVNQEGVTAKYNDGVLTVNLPKMAETKPKSHRIDIQ
jgi:HSP20 family protein